MRILALAGMCFASALTGACAAITAIPPWVMMLTAISLFCAALRWRRATPTVDQKSAAASWFALGMLAGLMLPAMAPRPGGEVLTRAPGTSLRGDLFEVLNHLDEDPSSLLGRRTSVSGTWTPARGRVDATVSRRVMSCCSADAVEVGFDVEGARDRKIRSGTWIRVVGVVQEKMRDGEPRYVLEQSSLTTLEDPVLPVR
jgi:uncharacterized protein DUF1980